jgi:hypothetical protein
MSALTHMSTTPLPPTLFRHCVRQLPLQGHIGSRQSRTPWHFVASGVPLSLQALHGFAGGKA